MLLNLVSVKTGETHIVATIKAFITNGAFGVDYPFECYDGRGICGTDDHQMGLAVKAEISEIEWPLRDNEVPPTLAILDLVEFCHRVVAKPYQRGYHEYFDHYHLDFNREEGQIEFRERINRILGRNDLAYELQENGEIVRLTPTVLGEDLTNTGSAMCGRHVSSL